MTIEELKQQFAPKRCSSQAEFDRFSESEQMKKGALYINPPLFATT